MKLNQTVKHIPIRTCVGCRQKFEKNKLLRIVLTESDVVVDKSQKVNQRGFYICKNQKCLDRLMKNKHFLKKLTAVARENLANEMEKILNEQ